MNLEQSRKTIDEIDSQLTALFAKRMACTAEIAAYKKENNQWIGQRDGERRYKVVEIGTLVGGYRTDGLYRITAKRINAKRQQKNATEKLQIKDVLVDIVKDKAHSVTRQQSVCNVTQ